MPIIKRKRFVNQDTGLTAVVGHSILDRDNRSWTVKRIVVPGTNTLHPDGRLYVVLDEAGVTGTPEGKHPYDLNLRWR